MIEVKEIKPLKKYKIWVHFRDGTKGQVDLSHLAGKGILKRWEESVDFDSVHVDEESGAIAWDKELEICPQNVYYKIKNINPEEKSSTKERV